MKRWMWALLSVLVLLFLWFRPDAAQVQDEVAKAVQYAYSLEAQLWQRPTPPTTRDEVYAHFRRGFSDELAASLTDYAWTGDQLRASDPMMGVPEAVHIVSMKAEQVVVYYETPENQQTLWGMGPYLIDTLRREGGRWVVVSSTQAEAPPALR